MSGSSEAVRMPPESVAEDRSGKVLGRLSLLNAGLLLVLYLVETVVAERWWLAALLLYAPQAVFGLPGLVLCGWAWLNRQGRWLVVNGGALIFLGITLMGLHLPFPSRAAGTGSSLRVMTYNVHHGMGGVEALVEVVNKQQVDVLCLQEVNGWRGGADPLPELKRRLPGRWIGRYGDLATCSRYPVVTYQIYPLPAPGERVILETVLDVKGQHLTVLNLHLATNSPYMLRRNFTSLSAWLRQAADIRATQVSRLLEVCDLAHDACLLVAGDFNNPPRGRLYQSLSERFQDAFRKVGWGTGFTFPAFLPAMRIDYLLAGPGVHVVRCWVPRTRVSDHLPVVADLRLTAPPQQAGDS